jgi:hypothetical protein
MGDTLLNGRPAEDFELAAMKHGRECERDRDAEVVAGLLADPRAVVPVPRPVTDAPLPVLP